jgi:bifunctional non-homologous end joining protein LigD
MAALDEYRRKRKPGQTDEPAVGASDRPDPVGDDSAPTFVIQEHHARALHWDFRLERDGVLVSWALPKGLPDDPKANRLAVHVEDHPLEYASFEGSIGHGQYGSGQVTIWDHGHYETEKWTEREVKIVLHGGRSQGRFVLFRTDGKNWMIHRMDAPVRPGWRPLPTGLDPMLPRPGPLPAKPKDWSFELQWTGTRALIAVDGGRLRVRVNGADRSRDFAWLRELGLALGSRSVLLDGVAATLDPAAGPTFLAVDLLHDDGTALLDQPYSRRRERLEQLALAGSRWQTPPAFGGTGRQALAVSRRQGLAGVIAKRADSPYRPGHRGSDWLAISNSRS